MASTSGLVSISYKNHHQTLTERIWHSFQTKTGVDIELVWGAQKIGAHRFLLDLFMSTAKLLEVGDTIQQYLGGRDCNLLELLLEFLYTGRLSVARERLTSLLALASYAEFTLLVDTLQEEILTRDQLERNSTKLNQHEICADNAPVAKTGRLARISTVNLAEIKIHALVTPCYVSLKRISNSVQPVIKKERVDPGEINNQHVVRPKRTITVPKTPVSVPSFSRVPKPPDSLPKTPVSVSNNSVSVHRKSKIRKLTVDMVEQPSQTVSKTKTADSATTKAKTILNPQRAARSSEKPGCSQWNSNGVKVNESVYSHYNDLEGVIGSCVMILPMDDKDTSSLDQNGRKDDLDSEVRGQSPGSQLAARKIRGEYRCHVCQSRHKQKGNLRRHMLIHTGERPYKCNGCTATFRRNDLLKKHATTCNINLIGDTWSSDHQSSGTFDNSQLKCQTCGNVFISKFYLKMHREKLHPNATVAVETSHKPQFLKVAKN